MVHKLLSNLLKRYSRQRASIEALSAFVDLPIAFLLITNFEQPVLGIVAFAALRTNDISAQAAALAVVIRCNSKTGPATAGDQEHFRPDRLFFGGRTRRHRHILLQMPQPGNQNSAAVYTTRPPTMVSNTFVSPTFDGSTLNRSCETTIASASLPGSSEPSVFSRWPAYAALSV